VVTGSDQQGDNKVTVRVLFFASLREAVGSAEVSLDLTAPISLEGLMEKLETRIPSSGFAALTGESVRVAVNQTLSSGPILIHPGDEVAFLPPVTGG